MRRESDGPLATVVASSRAPYSAPRWLPGPHLQTIYPALLRKPVLAYRREIWETPDGDEVATDWIDGATDAPLTVLFHGLEGSSRSHYAIALMRVLAARGWRGVVYHFRGCGGLPNRLPRAYHSGDTAELDWVLPRLKAVSGPAPFYVVGVSLGGNVLLKWLGQRGSAADPMVAGAAAVSAPFDLVSSGDALGRGFNRLYARIFLGSLKPKVLGMLERHPGLCDRRQVMQARTLREFDDAFTAPVHGFRDTDDYWTQASSKPWFKHIAVPTLVLNARNDPFLPESALADTSEISRHVTLEYPAHGGHVGFCSGPWPGRTGWLPQRILEFFTTIL
ncbi:MAG: alpha/beta fold hydrolase [Betaproteobacteria bacterium]|nr:alpha/beta fold hydrolase [Betaproteobacteria bacterium]